MEKNQPTGKKPRKSGLIRNALSKAKEAVLEFFQREETMETIKTVGKIILMVVIFVCVTIFLAFVLVNLLTIALKGIHTFWLTYADAILTIVGVGGVVYWWISTRKKEEPPPPPPLTSINPAMVDDKGKKQYGQAKEILLDIIIKNAHAVGLTKPNDETDIQNKPRFTPNYSTGEVTLHFDVEKKQDLYLNEGFNIEYAKRVFRKRIYQYFDSGKSQTITPHFIYYNTYPFPALVITDIIDKGQSIRIDLIVASPTNLASINVNELNAILTAASDCDFLE